MPPRRPPKKNRAPEGSSRALYLYGFLGLAIALSAGVFGVFIAPSVWDYLKYTLPDAEGEDFYMGPQRILQSLASQLTEEERLLKQEIQHLKYDLNGPGFLGQAVKVPPYLKEESEKRYTENNFDVVVSDLVSINRELKDSRNAACRRRYKNFDVSDLPTVSIIIVFHNEAFSTLIRTLHSILHRTPMQKVKDIILVDDLSDREHLGDPLDVYLKEFPVNVTLIRLNERSGLIRARLRAADVATGDILLFLDAHIEVTKSWLEPLLDRVNQNPKALVAPLIDVIDLNDFEYRTTIDGMVGGFNWRLTYSWSNVDEVEKARRGEDASTSFQTPVIAGGLFAVRKDYFYHIGTYDRLMKTWGGENVEISMRVWRCGGILEINPCSRVGHVFRKISPYTFPGGIENDITHNEMRTAKVWLDDYLPFYYAAHPYGKSLDIGPLDERLALKEALKCKSFEWYIENIYRKSSFPLKFHWLGRIRDPKRGEYIDSRQDTKGLSMVYMAPLEETYVLRHDGIIHNDHVCIKMDEQDNSQPQFGALKMTPFPDSDHKQCAQFDYNPDKKSIVERSTKMCVVVYSDVKVVKAVLANCASEAALSQEWEIDVILRPNAEQEPNHD